MKRKAFIQKIIDAVMLFLLPVLMAEILTGQQAHEWLGTGMVLLFILHHILNFGCCAGPLLESYCLVSMPLHSRK